jgi:hypothetical protein
MNFALSWLMMSTETVLGSRPSSGLPVHWVSDITPKVHAVEAGGVQACTMAAVETVKSYCALAPRALVTTTETVKAVFSVAGAVHSTCEVEPAVLT